MTWIAGQVVTAAQLNLNAPQEWQDWTPAFLGGMTVGNGSFAGRYCRHGNTIVFHAQFVMGSTSAVTGVAIGTLPVDATASQFTYAQLSAHLVDSGSNDYDVLARQTQVNGVSIYGIGTGGIYSATYPFTLGTGDYMEWRGIYEAEPV